MADATWDNADGSEAAPPTAIADPGADTGPAPSAPSDHEAVGAATAPIDIGLHRFRSNIIANVLYLAVNAALQFWFTRYLIQHLGLATYGLVPLAINLTSYAAVLTIALSGSVGRFLTIDLARGDLRAANRTFNTSLFASLGLSILLVPVTCAVAFVAPPLLNLPEGQGHATTVLLLWAGASFLLTAVGSNFAVSTFTKNHFDIQRVVDLAGQLAQVGCAVLLFAMRGPGLWEVGLGLAAMAVVRQIGYYISWRRLTPELSIRASDFGRDRLRSILGLGYWIAITHSGWILLRQVELPVANVLVGAEHAGIYASLQQCVVVLGAMAGTLLSVLVPVVMVHQGRGDTERLVRFVRLSIRCIGLGVALPLGLAMGFARPLLTLWLGDEVASYAGLLALMLSPLGLVYSLGVASAVLRAANRMRLPSLTMVGLGLINVGLAIVLIQRGGMGLFGIAVAGVITVTGQKVLVEPIYAAKVLGLGATDLLRPGLEGIPALLAVAGCSHAATRLWHLHTVAGLALAGLAIAVPYLLVVGGRVLRPEERVTLARFFGARGGAL